jgi:hypothetical protein
MATFLEINIFCSKVPGKAKDGQKTEETRAVVCFFDAKIEQSRYGINQSI